MINNDEKTSFTSLDFKLFQAMLKGYAIKRNVYLVLSFKLHQQKEQRFFSFEACFI